MILVVGNKRKLRGPLNQYHAILHLFTQLFNQMKYQSKQQSTIHMTSIHAVLTWKSIQEKTTKFVLIIM